LFERYQRSERALVAALAEMYVQGVSTRKSLPSRKRGSRQSPRSCAATMLGQRLAAGLFAAVAALTKGFSAHVQEKKIKIGVIFDLTGPLAGGGSELQYIGAGVLRTPRLGPGDRSALIGRDRHAYAG
jgi:hypothetical protein